MMYCGTSKSGHSSHTTTPMPVTNAAACFDPVVSPALDMIDNARSEQNHVVAVKAAPAPSAALGATEVPQGADQQTNGMLCQQILVMALPSHSRLAMFLRLELPSPHLVA